MTVTPQLVLNALRHWWILCMPVGLLLGGIGAAVVYLQFEPVYQASTMMRISSETPYIAFQQPRGRNETDQFVRNQTELIRSRLVLGRVASRPEIARLPQIRNAPDPITALGRYVSVSSMGGSDFFQISFTSPNPEDAALVANAVAEAYFALQDEDEAARTQRVIDLLEDEQRARKQEVERLRENLRELTKQATGRDPFAVTRSQEENSHPVEALQSRIVDSEVEEAILKAHITAYEEWLEMTPVSVPDVTVERTVSEHPDVQHLQAQLQANAAKAREHLARSARGEQDRQYQNLQQEIERDEQRLKELQETLFSQAKEYLETKLARERQESLAEMKNNLAGLELSRQVLQQRYQNQVQDVQEYSGDTLELKFLDAELSRAENVLDLISTRIIALRTERRAPERVEMLEQAVPPTAPAQELPLRMMFALFFAGLVPPFGLALLWEMRVRRLNDRQQLEQDAKLPVIGEIASLPIRRRGLRSRGSNERSLRMFEESVDGLRTMLALSGPLQGMQVLTVTSAASREGKTSVASQLAVSVARSTGQLTLLIDADTRAPDQHDIFEVPLEPGLAKLLSHQCTLQEAAVPSSNDRLHILPAGKLQMNPHKLVGNGALSALLEEARATYRYIIIDTPPILAASESLVWAKAADASVVCAMRDVSRVDQIRIVCRRLVDADAPVVGVVINGVPPRKYAYSYGYYGYSRE